MEVNPAVVVYCFADHSSVPIRTAVEAHIRVWCVNHPIGTYAAGQFDVARAAVDDLKVTGARRRSYERRGTAKAENWSRAGHGVACELQDNRARKDTDDGPA